MCTLSSRSRGPRRIDETAQFTRLELRITETFWTKGPSSIRELLEAFPEPERPAYTTVQAVVSRRAAQHRMIDDLVGLFGGKRLPILRSRGFVTAKRALA
jgi:hypothetical protein